MSPRRIRVDWSITNSFVLTAHDGVVKGVSTTAPDALALLGRNERDVAEELKARGATFTDLALVGSVRPARGWAERERRMPRRAR